MSRFITRERNLTPEERIAAQKDRVTEAEINVELAKAELERVLHSEPPLSTTEYVELQPGDPGYEEARYERTWILNRGGNPAGLGNVISESDPHGVAVDPKAGWASLKF